MKVDEAALPIFVIKASDMSREERVAAIEWDRPEIPIQTQAELLSLNRSSLYYKPAGVNAEEIALKRRIDEIYTEHPFYGSRRIAAALGASLPTSVSP